TSEHDAWFGLGYAEAQDRLFQMELTRRTGQGRLSELFGEKTLAVDRWARTIGFARIADQMWLKAGSQTRDIFLAYTSGINQYIHTHSKSFGFEFDALKLTPEDWRPQDCLIIGRLMSWEMNFSYLSDAAFGDFSLVLDSAHMRSLYPDYPDDGATVLEGADPANFVTNYLQIAAMPATTIGRSAKLAGGIVSVVAKKDTSRVAVPIGTATTHHAITPTPKNRPSPVPQGHTPPMPPRPRIPAPPKKIGELNGTDKNNPAMSDCFETFREVEHELSEVVGSNVGGGGSNAFALAPSRTKTGGAILENDTHLELRAPARWYLAHISSDDGLNVAGFLIPGIPLILCGRNADLSWGITNGMADECDYFTQKLDTSATSGFPRYIGPNGAPRNFSVIHDTIEMQDSIKTNPLIKVPINILMTVQGPVVSEMHPDSLVRAFVGDRRAGGISDTTIFRTVRPGTTRIAPVALQWNGLYALSDEMAGFIHLLRSKTIAEARSDMEGFATPCLNLCVADANGNIGYQYIGRLPRRSGNEERLMLPRDGSNPADAWTGFVHGNYSLSTPARGYIVSANNPPMRNRSVPIGNNWEPSSRADRIADLIEHDGRLDTGAIARIQTDVISPFDLRRVLSYLLALYPDPHPPRITPDSTSAFRLDSMEIMWKEDSLRKQTSISDSAVRLIVQKDSLYIASRRPPEDTLKTPKIDLFTAEVLDYLRNWDGGMRAEEISPTIFSVFLNRLIENTFRDELGTERYKEFIYLDNVPLRTLARILPDSANVWWDNVNTLSNLPEHRDSIIQISFRESLRILARTFGRDLRTWQWGRLHTLTFRHPFDKQSALVARLVDIDAGAMPGGPTTVWQATYYLWKPYEMQIGPSMRMIADMKSPNLLASLPTGNSEAIFGDHYKDMVGLFKRGGLITVPLFDHGADWKRFELVPK
ncbi:MAG TPA: penicillin acylase family protein, partial [Candidatus Kapabacteria bacterium]|nr:penicillin acylase family protein [Candidatus Kapabacteria bacterium]